MGRRWYEDGKLLNKRNTFNDFIDVTRFLVKQGYADPKRVSAMGGSAGGLLMGVDSGQVPVILRGRVDVLNTMLDPTLPLTVIEYDEWGNPEQKDAYDFMLSYSPYDNLKAQAYPATFVGTGLWDSQVQYFEPAKYVARLRDLNTGTLPVLFRTNMDAGHGGKSGRFRRYREPRNVRTTPDQRVAGRPPGGVEARHAPSCMGPCLRRCTRNQVREALSCRAR
jgi:oligopeptidase B